MGLQSTNRTKLGKVRETSYGVTPTNPVIKEVRNTSSSLNSNPATVTSNEIRGDRQITDLILTGQSAAGDIAGELSFHAQDDDFEEVLMSAWLVKPYIEVITQDTEISDIQTAVVTVGSGLGTPFKTGMLCMLSGLATAANNKLSRLVSSTSSSLTFPASSFSAEANPIPVGAKIKAVGFQGASADIVAVTSGGNALTSTLLDFTTLDLLPGDYIKIGDGNSANSFATAGTNGYARIAANGISANKLLLDIVPPNFSADAGTGKTIIVYTPDSLRNGAVLISSTFERQYLDHSPVSYEYFTGQCLNQMVVTFPKKAVVTVSKSYIGSLASILAARVSGASDVAAPTYPVVNSSSDIGELDMDGVQMAGPNFVMAAAITINNNLRAQDAIGYVASVGIGTGEFGVTLSQFQTYFGSKAILDKMLAGTTFGFSTRIVADSSNKETYVIDLPSCQLQKGAPSIAGKNNDVTIDGAAQALMHPTLGYTMAIFRFWLIT